MHIVIVPTGLFQLNSLRSLPMAVKFVREGQLIIPEESGKLRQFGEESDMDLTLEWKDGQYWLHSDLKQERPIGVKVDEEIQRHLDYFKKSSLHKEILARAIGIKGGMRPLVLDLTAGLLGDALLFLAMGCKVSACERHPVIALLIKSALANARHPLLSNLTFLEQDASLALAQSPAVDVAYYDPMFEDPNHKALPRKEMRIFRNVIGQDGDAKEVLELALKLRARRLVVKRPRHSATLLPGTPLQYVGKATRYDVYLS